MNIFDNPKADIRCTLSSISSILDEEELLKCSGRVGQNVIKMKRR
jgi:hypothetical protein